MTFPDRHLLLAYSDAIAANLKAGNATSHTHRPALKTLLEGMGAQTGAPGIRATNEPQRIACGAPDYILTRGLLPLGYVEAKDVGLNPRQNRTNATTQALPRIARQSGF